MRGHGIQVQHASAVCLEHVPFYCYIVCDITPKLIEAAENVDLTLTPDAGGYFGFNSKLRAYVEIISFTKLVADAQKRNRVLFEMLNLPKGLGSSQGANLPAADRSGWR